jgi:PAS domain S-box-containing protein
MTDAVERHYGYKERIVEPEWWMSRIHPDDADHIAASLASIMENGAEHWEEEFRWRDSSGEYHDVYNRAMIVRDDDGVATRVVGTLMDMTQRKTAERRAAAAMAKLEAANKELDAFAYVVSHDLKAPLRAIGSLASWIQSDYWDKLDDAGRQQLGLLVGRARRMSDLVDGILQYSRVGRVTESSAPVSMNALVRETIDAIILPTGAVVRIDGDLPIVKGARTALAQVVQNLIGNAIKFNTNPDPEVVVSGRRDGAFFSFSVADNGPGIEARHFGRIFEMFQTLAPRDRVESTGIGLSIVKKIVEAHGGTITVTSTPGQGATFTFTVPA